MQYFRNLPSLLLSPRLSLFGYRPAELSLVKLYSNLEDGVKGSVSRLGKLLPSCAGDLDGTIESIERVVAITKETLKA